MSTFLTLCNDAHRILGMGSRGNTAKPGTVPTTTVGQTDELAEIVDAVIKEWQAFQNEKRWGWLDQQGTLVFTNSTPVRPLTTLTTYAEWIPFYELDRKYALIYLTSAGVGTERRIYFEDYKYFRGYRDAGTIPTGYPQIFTIQPDGDWQVYPSPDASYTIRLDYRAKAQLWAAASDGALSPADYPVSTKGLPVEHHEIIAWRAVKRIALTRQDPALYALAKQEVKERMIPICRMFLKAPDIL